MSPLKNGSTWKSQSVGSPDDDRIRGGARADHVPCDQKQHNARVLRGD